jgi:hypothetical protein
MAVKLAGLTHKIAIQLHLVADSCTICSSRFSIHPRMSDMQIGVFGLMFLRILIFNGFDAFRSFLGDIAKEWRISVPR